MNGYHDRREERREERRRRREEWRKRFEERASYGHYGMMYRSKHSHIWSGLFILLIGLAALVKAIGTNLPDWVFSWQIFLIFLGLFLGIRHGFRGPAWFILILIGGAFLLRDFYPELALHRYIWPMVLILIGVFILFRPRRRYWEAGGWQEKKNTGVKGETTIPREEESWSQEDFLHATSFFGGTKKNILSKDFKGGDIVTVFGGTELNLSQADINGTVPIEITTVLGGTKLILPSNWEVKSEVVTIFGGMEDKRPVLPEAEHSGKILVLKGTVIFGGIEIKSY